jgi:hypothetical protein
MKPIMPAYHFMPHNITCHASIPPMMQQHKGRSACLAGRHVWRAHRAGAGRRRPAGMGAEAGWNPIEATAFMCRHDTLHLWIWEGQCMHYSHAKAQLLYPCCLTFRMP